LDKSVVLGALPVAVVPLDGLTDDIDGGGRGAVERK
jgi:hypothetical protein